MNRTAQRRLARLEKRHLVDPYDQMSDEELDQIIKDELAGLVREHGVDGVRAMIDRDFTMKLREQFEQFQADGFFPDWDTMAEWARGSAA